MKVKKRELLKFAEVIKSFEGLKYSTKFSYFLTKNKISCRDEIEALDEARKPDQKFLDFELERVSESIMNFSKKKYIQNIVYEDGIPFDRLTYIFPKGVELVRSSTPLFAREKIIQIVKYLFEHPDDFNIKDLLKLVKNLRKEFELADIDDISMQSSCSNYESKVLEDKDRLDFVSGAHFAVKSAAYYNYLLNQNKGLQSKYEFIKSGTKIKYYTCKNKKLNDTFAFIRGSYPIEFAPEVDYDEQFMKSILSPINSIIKPLGLPEITKRLSVVLDIFGGF